MYTEAMANHEKHIASLVASKDSEFASMSSAIEGKLNRDSGFEGCKECDFKGFYFCPYSKEGLCEECEVKRFPERFHGCLFCRTYRKYSGVCLDCTSDIQQWFRCMAEGEEYNPKEYDPLCNNVTMGMFSLLNEKKYQIQIPFINIERDPFAKWPGFYCGNQKWKIPVFKKEQIDVSDITRKNGAQVVERELEKLGIHIFSEIQMNL